jgi:hypothetical protein
MVVKHRFKEVSIGKNSLIFTLKFNNQKEISLSEIDKVYLKPNKKSLLYAFVYIVSSLIIVLFLYWYSMDIALIVSLILIVIMGNKLNNYKSYELKISTKNGDFFIKKISKGLRYATIDFINSVRKEIFDYEIKKENRVSNLEVFLPIKKNENRKNRVEMEKLQE